MTGRIAPWGPTRQTWIVLLAVLALGLTDMLQTLHAVVWTGIATEQNPVAAPFLAGHPYTAAGVSLLATMVIGAAMYYRNRAVQATALLLLAGKTAVVISNAYQMWGVT